MKSTKSSTETYYKTTITLERIDTNPWNENDHEDFLYWLGHCPEIWKVNQSTEAVTIDNRGAWQIKKV